VESFPGNSSLISGLLEPTSKAGLAETHGVLGNLIRFSRRTRSLRWSQRAMRKCILGRKAELNCIAALLDKCFWSYRHMYVSLAAVIAFEYQVVFA
jgi:hypothetical protein